MGVISLGPACTERCLPVSQVLATVLTPYALRNIHCARCDEDLHCGTCSWAEISFATLQCFTPILLLFFLFIFQDRLVDEFEMLFNHMRRTDDDFPGFLRRLRRVGDFMGKRFVETWFTGPINQGVFGILALLYVLSLIVSAADGNMWHHGSHVGQLLWLGLAGWVLFGW